ncbi:hypothetical protein SAMN06296036_105179 [Pseudobacteriovorax antillogorgiicola]|uniref:Lipoprotein n=1 Tax=Pseudobacteriovorax antillogorgiicola TaxID=1513793 RepID=A0A1Y6BHW2_9BACT|nr:hypothetical protein EDD56_105145 [Pseudobacteriovorax antillogorgiicola]SMF12569.1 hypothetical protein SAMN06296036_105179 [Pseudobacteriovorax antillogorgiicola]
MRLACIFLFLSLMSACVTDDLKMSMVSAKALIDMRCPDEVRVQGLGNDRFAAACTSVNKGRGLYRVKCGNFPKSCKVYRLRKQ